jgi:hypothetical protein
MDNPCEECKYFEYDLVISRCRRPTGDIDESGNPILLRVSSEYERSVGFVGSLITDRCGERGKHFMKKD